MKMRTRTKIATSIIAVILSFVLLFTVIVVNSNTNQVVGAATRTVELSASTIDAQSILNEFDDAKLTKKGTTTYFEGYKALDTDKLSEIDYISEEDFAELEECTVKYNFSYDSETNIVTLAASATLPDGSIDVDEITGVGFLNENDEIDAVMNVDGDAVLLSEMRSAGMIENCGWFSRLIKKVAKFVAVVAVAAVAVAAVVVTAGAAAPAVVAAGVGVSTTVVAGAVATAATIGAYATITAAIAAGVYVAADAIDRITYNNVDYEAEVLTEELIKKLPTAKYYLAIASSDGKMVCSTQPINRSLAVSVMRANTVVSVYTFSDSNARGIAQEAGDFMSPIWDYRHQSGYFNHYHLGNLSVRGESHSACKSHAFYGFPVF